MNRDNNSYTIIYASVMVIIVAILLAFTSTSLRDRQKTNMQIDKMQQILRALNTPTPNKNEVKNVYKQLVKEELLVTSDGTVVKKFEGDDIAQNEAFEMNTANQFKLQLKDPSLPLPVYVAEVEGHKYYVFPLDGTGLWGPIWGFISIDATNGSDVFGTDFSHEGETPGLGAEIATPRFSAEFKGKHLFRDGEFMSIAIVKPGHTDADRDYVDGISGGTLTSNGVNAMMISSLLPFKEFIIKNKQQ